MSEEVSKLYIELPGDPVSGSMSAKNMIMLHEHRDVIIKLDFPEETSFRLVSKGKKFYDPKSKSQRAEYPFAPGEEVHIWLSKFHQGGLEIEMDGPGGWTRHSHLDPLEFDGADYSHNLARPAPIIIKSGEPGSPIGETLNPPKTNSSIPHDYKAKLAQSHQSALPKVPLAPAHQSTKTESPLLRVWDISKFPSISREEGMRMCHAYSPEPAYAGIVEIHPATELYRVLPDKDTVVHTIKGIDGAGRMVIDAITATLGQCYDRAKLVTDLMKAEFYFDIKVVNGVLKKFVIFKKYAGLRQFFTGTRYKFNNATVLTITAKSLSMGELAKHSAQGVRDSFTKGAAPAVLLIGFAIDTAQWLAEGNLEFERLFAKWTTTLLGTVIVTALVPFITAAVGGFIAGIAGVTAAGIAIGVGVAVIFVGVAVGSVLYAFGAEEYFYNLFKRLRSAWNESLENIEQYDIYEVTGPML